jgi:hypothetical protein
VLGQIATMTASVAACADCAHVVNRVTALEAQVAALEAQIEALTAQIAALGDVTPPPPPPDPQTLDAFTASLLSVTLGFPVTLTWATSNATGVHLNGVAVPASGSQAFTPSDNTTYTLTVDGAAAQLSSSLSVTVVAVSPPPPDPPPPPPPSPISSRIQIAYPNTNSSSANRTLHGGATQDGPTAWTNSMGDWLDSVGVFNGSTPYYTTTAVANVPLNIDISAIDGDLRLTGIRVTSVTIDGVAARGFWTDPTANQGQALPNGTTGSPSFTPKPVMVLNPTRGVILTVTPFAGGTLIINKVAGAVIQDFPMTGASNTPDIWELPLTDQTSLLTFVGTGHYAIPFAFNPEFGTDPDNGMPYCRFSSDPAAVPTNTTGAYSRLISWKPGLGTPSGGTAPPLGRESCYARWCLYIEDDVAAGFNETGMKLPGLSNDDSGQGQSVSSRTEHSPPGPNNGGLYGFLTYDYSIASGGGFGVITNANALLRSGRWYSFEQHLVMNTPGVADGVYQLWVNGNLTLDRSNALFRSSSGVKPTILHLNVYHGGLNATKSPLHYRIAKVAVSTSYIGIPSELQPASVPSFVPAVGTIANISLNRMADVNPCPSNACSYSGVSKQSSVFNDTGVVYAPKMGSLGSIIVTGGGHNDYYGSEVYRYDFATQLWTRITEPHNVMQATSGASLGLHADRILGEQWADTTWTTTLQNQPSAGHLYGYQVIIPVGAKDSLVTLARPALTPAGNPHGRIAHILDLAAQVAGGPATSLWQRVTSNLNLSTVPAYGGAVYDALRNRIWGTQSTGSSGAMYFLDLVTGAWTMTSITMGAFYGTLMRSETQDRMIYMRNYSPVSGTDFNTGNMIVIINPNLTGAGAVSRISNIASRVTGTPPPYDATNSPLGGGAEWCEDLPGGPGIVYYAGGGGNDVYICQPTGDFNTGVWNWTSQTLTPVTPADNPAVQLSPANCTHLHRFVYIPVLRCFVWVAGNGAQVNAWRLFA